MVVYWTNKSDIRRNQNFIASGCLLNLIKTGSGIALLITLSTASLYNIALGHNPLYDVSIDADELYDIDINTVG